MDSKIRSLITFSKHFFIPSNTLFTVKWPNSIVKASKEVIERKKNAELQNFFSHGISKENYDCSSGDHLFSKMLNKSFKAFKSKKSLRKKQLNYQGMQCQITDKRTDVWGPDISQY